MTARPVLIDATAETGINMAQPNVAREPSMDEILASIRKIIESNEPGIPGFPANDFGPGRQEDEDSGRAEEEGDAEDIHLTIDDDVLVAEFEAQQEQNRPTEQPQAHDLPQESARPAAAATPPLSLADVAARVRAASERHSAPQREAEEAPRARTENPLVTSRMAQEPATAMSGTEHRQEPVSAPQPQPAVQAEAGESAFQPPAAAPVASESSRSAVPMETATTALLSPAVGEQVARSFGDLALAVDSGARRSFDEIAEDMLRPMLQEWLDDNLPTLVERLVREEIERVARGAQ
jgi:cell pole-organizing protein PopZ